MIEENLEMIKEQHFTSYKTAIIDIIKNNTNVLVDEDIMSLLRNPPLDSMNLIKSKFLSLAKKNKVILNTEELSNIFDKYYSNLIKICNDIKKNRVDCLLEKINSYDKNEIIKLTKKDFTNLNKEIKNHIKTIIIKSYDDCITKKIDKIFVDGIDDSIKNKIYNETTKYFKGQYQKQLLENLDIKILVKDTILINSIKEQSDRYLFTLNNSRLFNDK